MNPPNTTASDTLVEAIARAMEPHVNDEMGEPFKSAWLADLAQAALTAITEVGFVVCPIEPTRRQLEAAEHVPPLFTPSDIYRAMITTHLEGDKK